MEAEIRETLSFNLYLVCLADMLLLSTKEKLYIWDMTFHFLN